MKTDTNSYWKLFKPKASSLKLKGDDHETLFAELVDNLVKAGQLDEELRALAEKTLVERERLASTGLGLGVSIPHVQLPGITSAVCSLSMKPEGVEWRAVDGDPVQIFFVVLRPAEESDDHDPETHIDMMRWITRLSRNHDFRRFALSAKTKKELIDLLKEMAGV